VQLGERHRLVAGLAQSLRQPLLLGINGGAIDRIVTVQRDRGSRGGFRSPLLPLDV
jgi:hypothetical protein